MRRMISEEKANLLNKQAIDSNGVIVDENDRELNGDVEFTGTVDFTGATVTGLPSGGTQLYLHKFSIQDVDYAEITGAYLYVINNKATQNDFDYLDFIKCCSAKVDDATTGTVNLVNFQGTNFIAGSIIFNTKAHLSTETL